MKQSFLKKTPWLALIGAWVIIMTGSWAADGLKGDPLFAAWCPILAKYQWLVVPFVSGVFVAASILLYHHRQAFSLARSLSRHLCEPHQSLTLLVSPSQPPLSPTSPLFPLRLVANNGSSVELQGKSLEEDIKELDKELEKIRWNWQQLLRCVLSSRIPQPCNACTLLDRQIHGVLLHNWTSVRRSWSNTCPV